MNYKAVLISLVIFAVLSGTVLSMTTQYQWEVSSSWYSYPVTTTTNYQGSLSVISSDDYSFTPHFKIPVQSTGAGFTPTSKSNTLRRDSQVWFFDGTTWTLSDNLGDKVLSNIVNYNDILYVSVQYSNQSTSLMQFDGHDWSSVNGTEGWQVTDMIEFDNMLFLVKNGSNEILSYNGVAWEQPSWSNITGVINLAVFQDSLYVSTQDELYIVERNNITAIDNPSSSVAPVPFTVYNDQLYCAYRNQIYAYTGNNEWALITVLEPLYYVSSMYPVGDTLYVGTRANPYENETKIFIMQDDKITETTITGNIVYTIDDYNGNIYAGTNLGLYTLTTTTIIDQSRIAYAEASALILGLTFILYALYTWGEACEDIILISIGLGFFTLLGLLLAYPALYLTYVIFLPPIAVFIAFTIILNYALDIRWDFRYMDKDVRVVAVVLVILLIIEITTQVFSKAIGL